MSGTSFSLPGRSVTRRLSIDLGGATFDTFSEVELTRDLAELAGSFTLRCYDPARSRAFLNGASSVAGTVAAIVGKPIRISIDGDLVLVGWIDRIRLGTSAEDLTCAIEGRDRAGDLVDCAAAPNGPAEFMGITLTELATRLAKPFGLTVRAEVDVGARFPRFGIEPSETAAEALRKACAQRAVLCVSDGIGGLVLTRGGQQRGPAALRLGESILESDVTLDAEHRFSEVIVKGQTEKAAGNRRAAARLDASVPPLSPAAPAPIATAAAQERAGVVMSGRARDAGIGRYRPTVVIARTQSGGASVQEQADWLVRVQRGKSTVFEYLVPDWRSGPERKLWRPNELVVVDDRFADVLADMLVVGVSYLYDEQGHRTRLRLAGREAFDLLAEGDDRQAQRGRVSGRALDATAPPLTAGR